jgi:hypothetical protein
MDIVEINQSNTRRAGQNLGCWPGQEGIRMSTVWIYEEGDTLHFFDSELEARAWLKQKDPEGVATAHQPGEIPPVGSADHYGVPRATERRDGRRSLLPIRSNRMLRRTDTRARRSDWGAIGGGASAGISVRLRRRRRACRC